MVKAHVGSFFHLVLFTLPCNRYSGVGYNLVNMVKYYSDCTKYTCLQLLIKCVNKGAENVTVNNYQSMHSGSAFVAV